MTIRTLFNVLKKTSSMASLTLVLNNNKIYIMNIKGVEYSEVDTHKTLSKNYLPIIFEPNTKGLFGIS